jgi:hypothetical protein
MPNNYHDTPAGQVEYEIYLLKSQAESLLHDFDLGKAPQAFRNNIQELKNLSTVINILINYIQKGK